MIILFALHNTSVSFPTLNNAHLLVFYYHCFPSLFFLVFVFFWFFVIRSFVCINNKIRATPQRAEREQRLNFMVHHVNRHERLCELAQPFPVSNQVNDFGLFDVGDAHSDFFNWQSMNMGNANSV